MIKLDWVHPVDNLPTNEKLHHFFNKKVTCDMWHMTYDMWQIEGGEHSLKISGS